MTMWQRIKRWLNRRWENWKSWVRAGLDAMGLAITGYSFFRSFGRKAFLFVLAVGMFLAPIVEG